MKFRIVETVEYEVDAVDEAGALEQFLYDDGVDPDEFRVGILDRYVYPLEN